MMVWINSTKMGFCSHYFISYPLEFELGLSFFWLFGSREDEFERNFGSSFSLALAVVLETPTHEPRIEMQWWFFDRAKKTHLRLQKDNVLLPLLKANDLDETLKWCQSRHSSYKASMLDTENFMLSFTFGHLSIVKCEHSASLQKCGSIDGLIHMSAFYMLHYTSAESFTERLTKFGEQFVATKTIGRRFSRRTWVVNFCPWVGKIDRSVLYFRSIKTEGLI